MTNPQRARGACPEGRELVACFAGLDTPAVSDALDPLGLSQWRAAR
ncbi:hypothetical protein [Burkholderia gladioli]|jgi:hypothetical protein|nr:hypothetical protein [Burkholderia gladioli]KAF1059974.1 hypothetical protein LvStA_06576 [Burkholderia gladioli]MDN7748784.1 hypothetical protein [Burkholderia gladioli]